MNTRISTVAVASLVLAACSAGVGPKRMASVAATMAAPAPTSLAAADRIPEATPTEIARYLRQISGSSGDTFEAARPAPVARLPATPVSQLPAPRIRPVAASVRAAATPPPAQIPLTVDGTEDCENCPGGHCKLPGR